jgi:hypothetical protein
MGVKDSSYWIKKVNQIIIRNFLMRNIRNINYGKDIMYRGGLK